MITCVILESDSLQNVRTEISDTYNDLDALLSEVNEQGSMYEKFELSESEELKITAL